MLDHFQNEVVNSLCFGANSKYLASGGSSGLVKVWDMKRKEMFKPLAVSVLLVDIRILVFMVPLHDLTM